MKKYFKIRYVVLIIFSCSFSVWNVIQATGNKNEGYRVENGGFVKISEYGYGFTNNSGKALFIPTKTDAEFNAFKAKASAAGVSVCNVVDGTLSGWSSCSVSCGTGTQARTCSGASCGGDDTCGGALLSQSCAMPACCTPTANWVEVTPAQCSASCGGGVTLKRCESTCGATCSGTLNGQTAYVYTGSWCNNQACSDFCSIWQYDPDAVTGNDERYFDYQLSFGSAQSASMACNDYDQCWCNAGYNATITTTLPGYDYCTNCVAAACVPVCDSSKICGDAYYGSNGCGGTCQAGSGCTTPTTLGIAVSTPGVGTGAGRIVSSPAGIDCYNNVNGLGQNLGTCSANFPVNTNVTLTAIPGAGSTFAGWYQGNFNNGCSAGTGNCSIYLNTYPGKGAIATFNLSGSSCTPSCSNQSLYCSGTAYAQDGCGGWCYGTADCSSSSSCPFLYAWNGQKYDYITDIKGQNIGFPANHSRAKKVQYFYPQQVVMNDVKPEYGSYKIKLRETINEADYIDEVKLLLIDHPKGYEVVSSTADDSLTFMNVKPESVFYTIKDPKAATSAADSNNKNVLDDINQVDNKTVYDYNNPDYYIDLDFGQINPDYAKLVIDGWSIYQLDREKHDAVQPYVEIINQDGQWEEVKKFGWPAGDMKTMVVDLSGKLKTGNHKIRMHLGYSISSMSLFDRIRLDDSAPVKTIISEVYPYNAKLYHAGRADLNYSDLNNRTTADDSSLPDNQNSYFYGNFTKYGSVKPLLEKQDDMFVIMRHGDGLDLSFQDSWYLPWNYERTPVLYSDLYYKIQYTDKTGSYGSQTSKSIYPLPFHGMSQYIYDESAEHYPDDQDHADYLKQWNTRVYEENK